MINEAWKNIFNLALKHLEQSKLPQHTWTFGGGTVLMHKFNHRLSKDIDIFFNDKQLLSYISPRVNDSLDDKIIDFIEQDNFVKIYLPFGEIDFIVAHQISSCLPQKKDFNNVQVNVEHPVEIISKKIAYRCKDFKPRDIFDLAIVYSNLRNTLMTNIKIEKDNFVDLKERIKILSQSDGLKVGLNDINILSGGERIRGKELNICSNFILEFENKLAQEKGRKSSLGLSL